MASIIPGFAYDIFISYRHNDNRSGASAGSGQGWVTEFVNAMQEELAATLKDPVSIYFDKNPHDGLLETHSVDKSLEGKLKCAIFIPIISQTYCDPKSFAWQHEFCAFNKLAKEDSYGRDVKLSGGNVASRILPVKIHDLDAEDKATIENELGGVLRAVDFIYKEAGVNRPLRPSDSKADNLTKTDYRNQVNKVANAVKEIIYAMKSPVTKTATSPDQRSAPPAAPRKSFARTISVVAIGLIVFLGLIYAASKYLASDDSAVIEKSVAVLPFADLSPDGDQEYLGDGISEEIINVLAQSPDLKVIARSSSFQFKGKNEDLRTIGKMLGVSTILEGSVRKYKDQVRITAQLIKVADGSHFWSKNFDQNTDNIFIIQDRIAAEVAGALKATLLEGETSEHRAPVNAEAYRLYQTGRSFYDRADPKDRALALSYFEQSVKLDSTFASAWSYLSILLSNIDYDKALLCNQRALRLDSHEPDALANQIFFACNELRFKDAQQLLLKSLPLKLPVPRLLRQQGQCYFRLGSFAEGIDYCQRALALDPLQAYSHSILGNAFAAGGKLAEAEASFRRSFEINKLSSPLIEVLILQKKLTEVDRLIAFEGDSAARNFAYALKYFAEGNTQKADDYGKKVKASGDSFELAKLHAFRGELDEAFRSLDKAVAEKSSSLVDLKVTPFFVSLRKDGRYRGVVEKLGFPE